MADDRLAPQPFHATAAGALAPVAGEVAQVRQKAEIGGLRLDVDAAKVILRRLAELKEKAQALVIDCGDLDTPLRFGDNWVGEIMSERLRTVAVNNHGGVTPVLKTFAEVLADLEYTVRAAAGLYYTMDEEAAADLERAVRRFGLQVEE